MVCPRIVLDVDPCHYIPTLFSCKLIETHDHESNVVERYFFVFDDIRCIVGTRMTGRSGVPIVLLITFPFENSIKATSWKPPNIRTTSGEKD